MRVPHLLVRIAAASGLAVSLLLLAQYADPLLGLCAQGGGCDTVKASVYAHPLGVPLPLLGVAYFVALALVAAVPRLRRALLPLALTGGAGALALLAIQAFVIGAFCRLCLVADGSALLAGVAALLGRGTGARAGRHWFGLSAALTALALAVPAVMVQRAPAPPPATVALAPGATLPAPVAREQRPGVLTIVEFVDFECPFCRRLHAAMAEATAGLEGRVRVVRKMTPLVDLHAHALDAALAWCCADQVGRGDAMADGLAAATDLSRAGCAQLASQLGLDAEAFGTCVAAPATQARVGAELADADAAGVTALPTYWIGATMYRGPVDASHLRARIVAELERHQG